MQDFIVIIPFKLYNKKKVSTNQPTSLPPTLPYSSNHQQDPHPVPPGLPPHFHPVQPCLQPESPAHHHIPTRASLACSPARPAAKNRNQLEKLLVASHASAPVPRVEQLSSMACLTGQLMLGGGAVSGWHAAAQGLREGCVQISEGCGAVAASWQCCCRVGPSCSMQLQEGCYAMMELLWAT